MRSLTKGIVEPIFNNPTRMVYFKVVMPSSTWRLSSANMLARGTDGKMKCRFYNEPVTNDRIDKKKN